MGKASSEKDGAPGEGSLGQPRDVRSHLGTGAGDARQVPPFVSVIKCVVVSGMNPSKCSEMQNPENSESVGKSD